MKHLAERISRSHLVLYTYRKLYALGAPYKSKFNVPGGLSVHNAHERRLNRGVCRVPKVRNIMRHIVTFSGEYDLSCKDELHDQFDAIQGEPNVVLDLSEVTYLDSSFLSELFRFHEARKERGFPTMTLVIPQKSVVQRLFEIVGIAPLFTVVRTLSNDEDANGDSRESDFTCIT